MPTFRPFATKTPKPGDPPSLLWHPWQKRHRISRIEFTSSIHGSPDPDLGRNLGHVLGAEGSELRCEAERGYEWFFCV
jgi:hypothetical protein